MASRKRILLIQGHPDWRSAHFCHALAGEYRSAAMNAGHEIRTLDVARLQLPLLRSAAEWQDGSPVAAIREAQASISWADHLVIVFPLWLGDMPAVLKGFFERILEFCGVSPVRTSIVGTVAAEAGEDRDEWLGKVASLGFRAA